MTPRARRIVLIALLAIPGVVIVGLIVTTATGMTRLYRIPSAAMEPTLRCARPIYGCTGGSADRVIVCHVCYSLGDPGRGDIVAFRTPPEAVQNCGAGGIYIKRIVGMPGERWEERNGFVYIDGKRLDEPYVEADQRERDTYGPRTIPEGRYFVMGDNRPASCDSRRWGTVERGALIGKLIARYWPPSRWALGQP